MSYLFLLLFVAAIIALIVGLIKPRLVLGKNASRLGVLVIYSLGALASIVGVAITAPRTETAASSQAQPGPMVATAIPAAQPAPKSYLSRPIPETQKRFVAAVESARDRYRAAQADIEKGAARATRKAAICGAIDVASGNASPVRDWVGRVRKVTVNSDGKGVVEINVSPNVVLKTWNNALSDTMDKTLIEPNTPVYDALLAIKPKEGDEVVFSAGVGRSDVDCVRETSLSLAGSMLDPEFLMRVREIRRAE